MKFVFSFQVTLTKTAGTLLDESAALALSVIEHTRTVTALVSAKPSWKTDQSQSAVQQPY